MIQDGFAGRIFLFLDVFLVFFLCIMDLFVYWRHILFTILCSFVCPYGNLNFKDIYIPKSLSIHHSNKRERFDAIHGGSECKQTI